MLLTQSCQYVWLSTYWLKIAIWPVNNQLTNNLKMSLTNRDAPLHLLFKNITKPPTRRKIYVNATFLPYVSIYMHHLK